MIWIMWKGNPIDIKKVVRFDNDASRLIVYFTGGPPLTIAGKDVDEFRRIFYNAANTGDAYWLG